MVHHEDVSWYTQASSVASIVADVRVAYEFTTRDYDWRIAQLKGIKKLLVENRDALAAALEADLRRPALEAVLFEIVQIEQDVDDMLSGLAGWMADEALPVPVGFLPARAHLRREPLGVALIIAPWNFPLSMILQPLAAALAAGNAAVVKPSEVSPACARALGALLPRYVDAACVRVVQGAVAETTALLHERFDHIFYTGNSAVGRVILEAAAKHLTPVTLELGGKSPVIVAADADLDVAAARIVVGKCVNAGQICVAPDYILADAAIVEPLTAKLADAARRMYGADMASSPDFGRVVNGRHFARLQALLASNGGGRVAYAGGTPDAASKFMPLTLIREPAHDSPLLREEIFGPLLPILAVASVDAAVAYVNARPKPLALYVFSRSSATTADVLARTSSGGAGVNACVFQQAVGPFGGVGPSGMGAYHGRYGFETFSHRRPVFDSPTWPMDAHALLYPPYAGKLGFLTTLLGVLPHTLPAVSWKDAALALAVAGVAALAWRLRALEGGGVSRA